MPQHPRNAAPQFIPLVTKYVVNCRSVSLTVFQSAAYDGLSLDPAIICEHCAPYSFWHSPFCRLTKPGPKRQLGFVPRGLPVPLLASQTMRRRFIGILRDSRPGRSLVSSLIIAVLNRNTKRQSDRKLLFLLALALRRWGWRITGCPHTLLPPPRLQWRGLAAEKMWGAVCARLPPRLSRFHCCNRWANTSWWEAL